ncbi:hypothetical protein Tco_0104702 [Tanacetum coccineum]
MSLSLAENVIVAGADNRPPMLDKTNYSSWASRMLLYIKGKEHGKLLVDSVLNGLFQYGTTVELEMKILQQRSEHEHTLISQIWDRVKLLIQGLELSLQQRESKLYDDFDMFISSLEGQSIHITCVVHQQPYQAPALQQSYQAPTIQQPLQPSSRELDLGLVVPSFNPYDDHIANLNKLMVFGARNNATNQGANRNGATGQARVIKCYNSQKEDNGDTVTPVQSSQEISSPTSFQTDVLDAFDSDCDDAPSTKEVFMTNLSSYDSDVLSEHIICQDVMNIAMHADSLPVNLLPANNKCLVHDNLEIERLERENDHLF